MSKLKVATLSRGVSRKTQEIARYMVEHPEGCTPKMISSATSINVNTVKTILKKLNNVTTVARGLYKVVNGGDTPYTSDGTLHDWNFHNLILQVQLIDFHPSSYQTGFDLINLDFCISSTGLCTLRLATDHPLNVSSICLVYGYLKELIKGYSSDQLSMKQVVVKAIEFNQDQHNLRLDGINSIALDSLCAQFKLYQKKLGLRVEHKTKMHFNVDTMVDMLTCNPNTLDLQSKLNQQTERLNKLTGQAVYNTKLLQQLVGAMK